MWVGETCYFRSFNVFARWLHKRASIAAAKKNFKLIRQVTALSRANHGVSWAFSLFLSLVSLFDNFYRAMHFSAKRGLAIACRPSLCLSVCPSVRPSVCDVDGL